MDMGRRCGSWPVVVAGDGKPIHQAMRSPVVASTKGNFDKLKGAVGGPCSVTLTYRHVWLPCKRIWVHDSAKWLVSLG